MEISNKKRQKENDIKSLDLVENEINILPTNTKQKCNDVDDVDDDAAWMEDKVIDRVNTYCLAHIFKHIPPFERPKVAQVCKKWKEALSCSWSNVKKLENLYWGNRYYKTEKTNRKWRCLKGLINQCGRYLTELNMIGYSDSNIMPLIKKTCPQLVSLRLRFAHIKNVHFEIYPFSNMSNLQSLKIIFQCNSRIPTKLINSLIDVADTLNHLAFFNWKRTRRNEEMPDIFVSVLPQLIALQNFELFGYEKKVNRPLFDSIPTNVDFFYQDDHLLPSYNRFKYVKAMRFSNFAKVTDDLLINVANNARELETLEVWSSKVTDIGIIALAHAVSLKRVSLKLQYECYNNITDSSVQFFKNMTYLDVRMCNVTNYSIIKVIENSPDLTILRVAFTKVTHELVKKAAELTRNRKDRIFRVYTLSMIVSLENIDGIFDTPEYQSPFLKLEIVDSTEDLVDDDD